MIYDYSKLRGKIVEKYGTQSNFATVIGLSERTLSNKLNSKKPFKQPEISSICSLMNIPDEEIPQYFFAKKVQ